MAFQNEYEYIVGRRFDKRVRSLTIYTSLFQVVVVIICGFLDESNQIATLSHLAISLMALCIGFLSRDGVRTILFTNVYWTFSFMTYLYALLHFRLPTTGLYDADQAALIAFVSQLGLFLMSFIVTNKPIIRSTNYNDLKPRISFHKSIFLLFYILGVVGVVGGLLGMPNAVAATLKTFLYLALGLRLLKVKERVFFDPYFVFAVSLLVFLSLSNNSRTALLSVILFLGFFVAFTQEKLIRLRYVVFAYIGISAINTFSLVMLEIRQYRETASNMVGVFVDKFFSMDTLLGLINPFYVSEVMQDRLYKAETYSSLFQTDFFEGGSGVFSRLTVLPQMDIATSNLSNAIEVKWQELGVIFASALPDFGQTKNLLLSDQIVWGLGLRDPNVIGRPMITAQGEIFYLGGYLAVFILIPLLYSLMYLGYRWFSLLLGSRFIGSLLMSQLLINSLFSTTLLSLIVLSIRAPLQISLLLIFVLYIAKVSKKFSR
ncbi:hypothetical protein EOL70_16920 [Leucothrix sargassi]|nr:hypothetical protein EOL70_16920 [Leucothrix sargassi]